MVGSMNALEFNQILLFYYHFLRQNGVSRGLVDKGQSKEGLPPS